MPYCFPRGKRRVNVDAQHFPQERGQILAIAHGIATAAAVSQPDIQETVGAEDQLAALVIGNGWFTTIRTRSLLGSAVLGSWPVSGTRK